MCSAGLQSLYSDRNTSAVVHSLRAVATFALSFPVTETFFHVAHQHLTLSYCGFRFVIAKCVTLGDKRVTLNAFSSEDT